MKNFKIVLLLLAVVFYSCSNVDFVNDDVNAESEVLSAEKDFSLKSTDKLISGNSLRLSNGTQEINGQQTNSELERGVGVSIPLAVNQQIPVVVKTGTWVTLRFNYVTPSQNYPCPEVISEDEINNVLQTTQEFIDQDIFALYFNGEEIDLASNFRDEEISLGPGQLSDCDFTHPWRYYVSPQAKGDYTFTLIFNGLKYSRTISWVEGI